MRASALGPIPSVPQINLAADAAYDELVFLLQEGETLTFHTDGILEARNPAGELYGFERLAALVGSDRTIEQMVEEARNFGQQDDITIFRVTRLAQSAPAHAAKLGMATQIAGT
jgi:serine phosphatase RsbU (regulator of sigma subunit)